MKLLAKSTRAYLVIASLILLIAIPVFYLAIQSIVREDVDESLFAQRNEMRVRINADTTLGNWVMRGFAEVIGIEPTARPNLLANKSAFDSISGENIPYRVLETSIPYKNQFIHARFTRSLIDGEDLIQSIVFVIMIILAFMIAGMILINRYLSRRLWSPFYKTLEQLRRFELEKSGGLEFPPTKIDEFNDLQRELDTLASRSRTAYLSQKAFTENASHELQTPLAVLQGKLDLLMQTEPITDEQAHLISGIADASQRMNYLNKNLVLVTRIENKQYHSTEQLSIGKELQGCIELYQDLAASRQAVIRNEMSQDINIRANLALINILLGNLLSNAIRHSEKNSVVLVQNSGPFSIRISNPGRTALDESHMYERFQQQHVESGGLGLGLAITQKICEVSGYQLSYLFKDNQHQFTVQFH